MYSVCACAAPQQSIRGLLSNGDFVGALGLISEAQKVLKTELAGVHSVRNTSSELSELMRFVERMMRDEFVQLAVGQCDSTRCNTVQYAATQCNKLGHSMMRRLAQLTKPSVSAHSRALPCDGRLPLPMP